MFDVAGGLGGVGVEDGVACEPFDFAGELGDDRLGGAFADFGEFGECFGVFADDGRGDGGWGFDHRAECFFGSDAFDGGEDFEKTAIGDGSEPDEPGDETGALPLGFEIEVGVEGDFGADLRLKLARKVCGDQDFDRNARGWSKGGRGDGAFGDGFELGSESGEHMDRGYPDLSAGIAHCA